MDDREEEEKRNRRYKKDSNRYKKRGDPRDPEEVFDYYSHITQVLISLSLSVYVCVCLTLLSFKSLYRVYKLLYILFGHLFLSCRAGFCYSCGIYKISTSLVVVVYVLVAGLKEAKSHGKKHENDFHSFSYSQ